MRPAWDRLEPRALLAAALPGDYDGDHKTDFAIFDPTSATFFVVESGGGRAGVQLGNPANPLTPLVGDYDGDGKSDFAVFDPTSATFFVVGSTGFRAAVQLGNPADRLVPLAGDYDGDGKTDYAVFDPTTATFFVAGSTGMRAAVQLGNAADPLTPLIGDYDGDHKTDFAIFDSLSATFFVVGSTGFRTSSQLGNASNGLTPLVGDYDGDGKADFAVFDPTTATFFVAGSSGFRAANQLGNAVNPLVPLVGDFNGDGKADYEVFDPTSASFFVIESTGGRIGVQLGDATHPLVPFVGDYNGDGKSDFTVFDPVSASFFVVTSSGGRIGVQLGNAANPLIPLRKILAPPLASSGWASINTSFLGFNGLASTTPDINVDGKTDALIYDPTTSTFRFAVTGFATGVPSFTGALTVGAPIGSPVPLTGDFNGDGKTDFAVYNPATATFIVTATGTITERPLYTSVFRLGIAADHPIPLVGDFNADGKTDLAVYDPVTSTFSIIVTQPFSTVPIYTLSYQFGAPRDQSVPLVGDFNGDGKTDVALYDPVISAFLFFITGGSGGPNSNTTPLYGSVYGLGDPRTHPTPLVGDFNGDGQDDFAIYDSTAGVFQFILSGGSSGLALAAGFYLLGTPQNHPTPLVGDFNADGKSDFAVYDPTRSLFSFVVTGGLNNTPISGNSYFLGSASTHGVPLSGDFNADGKTDVAFYDPATSAVSFAVTGTLNGFPLYTGFLQIGNPNNHPSPMLKGARKFVGYYG
jgi:FG-GAP-like repeat